MKKLPTFEVEGSETRRYAVTYEVAAESAEEARKLIQQGSGTLISDDCDTVVEQILKQVTMTDPGEPDDPPDILLPAEEENFVNDYEEA